MRDAQRGSQCSDPFAAVSSNTSASRSDSQLLILILVLTPDAYPGTNARHSLTLEQVGTTIWWVLLYNRPGITNQVYSGLDWLYV